MTHRPGYKKITFSGAGHPDGDIKEQTRAILAQKQTDFADLGGSMADVTALRLFVREDVLSPETQVQIHEVRAEFFEQPHYPAATMVGVAELFYEVMLIDIEIEAEIPADDWETEIIADDH